MSIKKIAPFLAVAILACLSACDNPQRTVDQTRKDLDVFRADPRAETQVKVEQSFTKLDEEVAKLQQKTDAASGDAQKKLSDELQKISSERASLVADYQTAKVKKVISDLKTSAKEIGNVIKNLGKSTESGTNQ